MIRRLLATVAMALAVASGVHAEGVVAPGAKLEKVGQGFSFTEGPTADAAGNVFFTDQPNDRIVKWNATDGKFSDFMKPAGRSNGMYFDKAGNLYSCADEKNELWMINPEGKVTVLVKGFEGKLLNGPNDVWVRPDGLVYMTDPYYKRPWWNRQQPALASQGVYLLSADHKTLKRVIDDVKQANGITGTPDGKTLYVADIGAGKTYRYDLKEDGLPVNKTLFCSMGSDGMTLDEQGNVYLTGKGVTVFDRSGRQIDHIDVPERWTANACFGGSDRRTLFITAGPGFYSIRMQTRGVGGK